MKPLAALALVLTACAPEADAGNVAGVALEDAAIEAGVVRDPDAGALAGLYARDTDQICIVRADGGYRIGASIDLGDHGCSAAGTATRNGERLEVRFDGAPGCEFEARLDGDRIVFPGAVPGACARLCTERASLAALEVDLLSEAVSEATAMRDRKDRELCRS